ncbi:MAG: efflux RND transporter periplasmic adaptor subunit [Tepidisphaeraceae bacterium]
MKRNWMSGMWIAAAVVVAAGGFYYRHVRQVQAAAAASSDVVHAVAEIGNISQNVATTGLVISNLDVQIKCQASGQVIKFPFDVSDHVKSGDLLLQVDPTDERRMADQAQAAVAISQAKLQEAKLNATVAELDLQTATEQAESNLQSAQIKATNLQNKADRQQQLLLQKLAAPEDYETAQTDAAAAAADLQTAKIAKEQLKSQAASVEVKKQDVVLAEAQLQSDQIALANALQQLSYTTVSAPMDGVVADVEVELGTIISSAIENVGGGTTVMTLSDLSKIFVNASVDESDIGDVRVGQRAVITADAYPGKTFDGSVVRIATQGVNNSNVVTFTVKIEVTSDNKELLKPQMTTNVQIIEAQDNNVVIIPSAAVVRREGKFTVSVVKPDGSTEDRDVEVGINDGTSAEIASGLQPGETVVVHRADANGRWTGMAGITRSLGMSLGGRR